MQERIQFVLRGGESMPKRTFPLIGLLLLAGLTAQAGSGIPALIVNDPTAIATVTTSLSQKLTAAGYNVTTNVGVPSESLASYKQVWDVRFANATPLSAADASAYQAYLAGGGSLFLMGENTGLVTRNNSIVAFVTAMGGGNLTVTTPNYTQTILSPFTGPSAVSTITFLACGGVPSPGHGAFITKDASNIGAAVVFGPGNLTAAPAGSLILVFDVNFLDLGADANSVAFANNLIAYLAAPVVVAPPASAVPTLSEGAMVLVALCLVFVAWKKLRPAASSSQP
jgi:hypothetical protein